VRWEAEDANYVYYTTFVADSGNHRLLAALERQDKITDPNNWTWLTNNGQVMREIVWASTTSQTVRAGSPTGTLRQQSRYRFTSITPVTRLPGQQSPLDPVLGNFGGMLAGVTNFGLERKVTDISMPSREPLLIEYPEKSSATQPVPAASIVFADGQIDDMDGDGFMTAADVASDPTPIGEIAWAIGRVYLYDRANNNFYRTVDGTPIEFGIIQKINSVEAEWADIPDYPGAGDFTRVYYLTVTATLLSPVIEPDAANPGFYVRTGQWVERVGVYPLVYPIVTTLVSSPTYPVWNEVAVVSLPGPVSTVYPYGQEWYFEHYDYVDAMEALGALEYYQEGLGYVPASNWLNVGEFPRQYTNPTDTDPTLGVPDAPPTAAKTPVVAQPFDQSPDRAAFFLGLFEPTWAKRIPQDTVTSDGIRLRQGHYLVANGSGYKGEILELATEPMLPLDPTAPMVAVTAGRSLRGNAAAIGPLFGAPAVPPNVRDAVTFICPAPYTYLVTPGAPTSYPYPYSPRPSLEKTFGLRQPAYAERVN